MGRQPGIQQPASGAGATGPALVVRHGARTVEVPVGGTLLVGRDDDADLTIKHPDVSRHHARFAYADGWQVTDESTNGTYLDGRRITEARIDGEAEVRVGSLESYEVLRVSVRPADPAADRRPVVAAGDDGPRTVLRGSAPQPFRDQPAPPPVEAGAAVITIGKASDNDIVVDDINASRHHARALVRDGGFLVEDLNSLNGTLLNAVPVQRAFMTDADRLTIGNTDLVRRGGTLVPARAQEDVESGLRVDDLAFTIPGGKHLIRDVALTAARGTLTAVIGPSGAGKSTLSRLLAGVTQPSAGRVSFDGFDLQRDYQAVKTRVGLVPQDDVVHRQLLLRTALRYAADLRLPGRLPKDAKAQQVDKVLGQLGLEGHVGTRIERLSGGQRKRASVALELLTEPSLLILDEPTSGLDPALDRQVMRTLRELADGDRTVIVITHSVAYLDICDQVLVLAPGGLPAYLGPRAGVADHFGTEDWGDIFAGLAAEPARWHERWAIASGSVGRRPAAAEPVRRTATAGAGRLRQFRTITVRQVNVMVADRGYMAFLLALPVILGLLPYVVPGDAGLTAVPRNQPDDAREPVFVLALLVIGGTFMGISMSIRDLVEERPIFLRERAVGLAPASYLLAKLVVFGFFSALSAAIMVAVSLLVKTPPDRQIIGIGPPVVELFVAIALTTWVAAALGLLISALATSDDQVMPVLILVLMVQLVLHGGLIPVLDRDVLNGVSKAVPARWGYSAAASGIDLQALLAPGRPQGSPPMQKDPLWAHTVRQWWTDMGVLAAFGVGFSVLTGARLRFGRR